MGKGYTMEEWAKEEKNFWTKEYKIMQRNGESIRHGHSIYEVRRQCARVMGKKLPALPKRNEEFFNKLSISRLDLERKIILCKIRISAPSEKEIWKQYLIQLERVQKEKKERRMRKKLNIKIDNTSINTKPCKKIHKKKKFISKRTGKLV